MTAPSADPWRSPAELAIERLAQQVQALKDDERWPYLFALVSMLAGNAPNTLHFLMDRVEERVDLTGGRIRTTPSGSARSCTQRLGGEDGALSCVRTEQHTAGLGCVYQSTSGVPDAHSQSSGE